MCAILKIQHESKEYSISILKMPWDCDYNVKPESHGVKEVAYSKAEPEIFSIAVQRLNSLWSWLDVFWQLLLLYPMFMSFCFQVFLCTICTTDALNPRSCLDPRTKMIELRAIMWVLRIKFTSSGREARSLNLWAISPGSN